MTKTCTRCNETKNQSEFTLEKQKNGTYIRRAQCSSCRKQVRDIRYKNNEAYYREKSKQYRANNRELYLAKGREAYKKNPRKFNDKRYGQVIKREFGITMNDYNKMLENQLFKCKLCGKDKALNKKRFAVDHCHQTNIIRGLLCDGCNRGIGLLRDDVNLLAKAIDYINKQGKL